MARATAHNRVTEEIRGVGGGSRCIWFLLLRNFGMGRSGRQAATPRAAPSAIRIALAIMPNDMFFAGKLEKHAESTM